MYRRAESIAWATCVLALHRNWSNMHYFSGRYSSFTEWLLFPVTIGTIALCVSYYVLHIGQKPKLIAKQGSYLRDFLVNHCPMLDEPYWPTIWCYGGRGQTIIGSIMKSHPVVQYHRELVTTPDGGELYLDWLNNGSTGNRNTFPTVLIMPGLTGDSQHGYVLHLVQKVHKLGYRSVVFNNRGLAGAKLKTPLSFCAADTEDIEFVINHVNTSKPGIPLVGVAVSLGGIILTNYLTKKGKSGATGLIAAMTLSVPWNTFKTSDSLEEPLNWFLFNRHLTKCLCNMVSQHMGMAKKAGKYKPIDMDHVLQSKCIKEFDERFVAPMFGFKDWVDYYSAASLHSKPLEEISIPLFTLSAADDPFAPGTSLPLEKIKKCPNVVMALTPFGGHIGFTEGLLPVGSGYADRLVCQFVKAIFENRQSLQDSRCSYNRFAKHPFCRDTLQPYCT